MIPTVKMIPGKMIPTEMIPTAKWFPQKKRFSLKIIPTAKWFPLKKDSRWKSFPLQKRSPLKHDYDLLNALLNATLSCATGIKRWILQDARDLLNFQLLVHCVEMSWNVTKFVVVLRESYFNLSFKAFVFLPCFLLSWIWTRQSRQKKTAFHSF